MNAAFRLGCLVSTLTALGGFAAPRVLANVGVGTKPLPGAEMLVDGTRATLDAKWTYWDGPRGAGSAERAA